MEYPDGISDAEDFQDTQKELLEEQVEQLEAYPIQKKPESLFTLFNKVLRIPDSSKVGNLDKRELGDLNISVRDCQRIALVGNTFRHERFAQFFANEGEITLSTSSSKKGWFVELFVTSKKFATKTMGQPPSQSQQQKWKLFGKKPMVQEQEPA